MGYIPQIETLKIAVRNTYSEITENILAIDNELIHELDDEDIEYLFSFDIDEETIETIRVLFNYKINPTLFSKYLKYLHNPDGNYFNIEEDDQDLIIELIDILESNGFE
jgi:hypothetical protein